MNKETLIKYLRFLKTECIRISSDNKVDENELKLFKLELEKFKRVFQSSSFDSFTKEKINNINFDLTPLNRTKGLYLFNLLLGEGWIKEGQDEENLALRFKMISEQIENTIFELKAHV